MSVSRVRAPTRCYRWRSPTAVPTTKVSRRPARAKVAEVQQLLFDRLAYDHPLREERIEPPLDATQPPTLWVRSTSPEGAHLAARVGSHYAFHDYYARRLGPESVRVYCDEFRASPDLAAPSWAVCVSGYCAADEAHAADAQARFFARSPAGRNNIVGTASVWRDELGALAASYGTSELIIQTLGGHYDLERQVGSFARIAEIARELR